VGVPGSRQAVSQSLVVGMKAQQTANDSPLRAVPFPGQGEAPVQTDGCSFRRSTQDGARDQSYATGTGRV
jgi:hypothetical protein